MTQRVQAIVLAAGKGTRMKSRLPKVLHELCGRSLLDHVLETLRAYEVDDSCIVISPDLREHVEARGLRYAVQEPQRGTGHAVQIALESLTDDDAPILVVSADMPLLSAALFEGVISGRQEQDADLALVTARVPLPSSFGRIIRDRGVVARIVEQRDATPAEQQIDEVNAGVYCFKAASLRRVIKDLRPDNAQSEFYLTDCVALLAQSGARLQSLEAQDYREVMGVNNRVELAKARTLLQGRILERHMLAGVTIVDPATTSIDVTVTVEPDTIIHPQSHIHGRSVVGKNCVIGPGTVITNANIGDGAAVVQSAVKDSIIGAHVSVGPFAHLRGNSIVEEGAHVGNFVEMKNTRMAKGAKAGHLAYLGDAEIGEGANIGAGTITCNYDGKRKNKTKIGAGAFIGSNSSLVAPVTIGDGALTGAGSVVIRDVPAGERVVGNPARVLTKKQVPEPT